MRTLLILTQQDSTAAALRSALEPSAYQLIATTDIVGAESLLERGAIDAAILDLELSDVRAIRVIERVKAAAPRCPVLVYGNAAEPEWEEAAYLAGAAQILARPIRGKLLNRFLAREFESFPEASLRVSTANAVVEPRANRAISDHVRALEALRDFSGVLVHSLNFDNLLKELLLVMRETIRVNRAIIFLRKPAGFFTGALRFEDDQFLFPACAIGIEKMFIDHFALSMKGGIGGYLRREGRILRLNSPEAQADPGLVKEFQILGTQVAIPIHDRESMIGVALFDERVTGDLYSNEELALVFHMLEEIGLAIKNTWLHEQLVSNHALIGDILDHLASGCVVVGPGPAVLHANPAARKFLLGNRSERAPLDFADLPQELGSKIYCVLKNGTAETPFQYRFAGLPGPTFQISISPFKTQQAAIAALVLIEDITEHERSQRLEIEASNLRLIKSMSEHLAHEIGNSLVPISTHQQLLAEKFNDPEFRESMTSALGTGVRRITRLADQMLFLAREPSSHLEPVRISQLIIDAFREAHTHHPDKVARLNFDKSSAPWTVAGDPKALRHAFSEVLLNALQANPADPEVSVKLEKSENGDGHPSLRVEVNDSGEGFSDEAAGKALDPFFSTRTVGLGLGLTVTRKIIENHHGKIEILPPANGGQGLVRISLPLEVDH